MITLDQGQPTEEMYTPEDVAAQIQQALADPSVPLFHQLWYRAKHTWPMTRYKGVPILKCPFDLQIYHELLWQLQPTLVIETGTCFGGSALWFADQVSEWGGRVLSIDIRPRWAPAEARNPDNVWPEVSHPAIDWIVRSSLAPATLAEVAMAAERTPGPVLVSLDSDHHMAHVAAELDAYHRFVTPQSYLVIEDTNMSHRPMVADDPGPGAAVDAFLETHPEFRPNALCERYLLTFHPRGWLARVG